MKKTKFALVGCGNIAKKHVHAINTYLEDAQITAFCDTDINRAQAFAKEHNCAAFSGIREMMDAEADNIDIVSILTPRAFMPIMSPRLSHTANRLWLKSRLR